MDIGLSGLSAGTGSRLVLDSGAVYRNFVSMDNLGTLVGATRGGNQYKVDRTIREVAVDGGLGKYKGLRRRSAVAVELVANMLEFTVENMLLSLAGSIATHNGAITTVEGCYLGDGTGDQATFTMHTNVIAGSHRVYVSPAAGGDPVLQVEGGAADYTVVLSTGVITFNAGSLPADGDHVTASYQYDTGGSASAYIIRGGPITDASYLTNVALVTTLSGKTDPIAFVVLNPLSDAGFDLKTADKDEAVHAVTFSGHFLLSAPGDEPWEVWHPDA